MAKDINTAVASQLKQDKADKAYVKAIRDAFEADQGHALKLTDESVLSIVGNIGKDAFEAMDGDDQIALFVKAEEVFKGIAVADPSIDGLVSSFDDEFYTELDTCVEAIIKNKQSSMDMFAQIKRVWTVEQFRSCPYPGSDKDSVVDTNYKADIVEKQAVAGGKIRTVWSDDMVYAMPKGKTYQNDIDDATKELKVSGSVARFKSKGKQELRDILNIATQGRNGMRKCFRTAVQLAHKLEAISLMPQVNVSFIRGEHKLCTVMPKDWRKKGQDVATFKVTRSPRPFWIKAVDKDGTALDATGKEFSAAQVIAFLPQKAMAMEGGGTMGELIASAKGEPESPETMGEKMSVETMDTTAVVMNAKLANVTDRAALLTRMLSPDNETTRASYCALFLNLKGFYDKNATWYETYLDAQGMVEKKEKTARANRAAAN